MLQSRPGSPEASRGSPGRTHHGIDRLGLLWIFAGSAAHPSESFLLIRLQPLQQRSATPQPLAREPTHCGAADIISVLGNLESWQGPPAWHHAIGAPRCQASAFGAAKMWSRIFLSLLASPGEPSDLRYTTVVAAAWRPNRGRITRRLATDDSSATCFCNTHTALPEFAEAGSPFPLFHPVQHAKNKLISALVTAETSSPIYKAL